MWVAFSAMRGTLAPDSDAAVKAVADSRVSAKAAPLSKKERLVFVVEGDTRHYHLQCHPGTEQGSQAISAKSAQARGLAACPDCFRSHRNVNR